MKKSGFLAVLIMLCMLLVAAVSPVAFAAEAQSELSLEASLQNNGDQWILTLTVQNNLDVKLNDLTVVLYDFSPDALTFAENNLYQGRYVAAVLNELAPRGTGKIVFQLTKVSDVHTLINSQVSFTLNDDTAYGGMDFNENNTHVQTFENILAEKTINHSKVAVLVNFIKQTGFSLITENYKVILMMLIAFLLIYLAIVKKFEPLLLLPIAFGMLLTNLPGAQMFHEEFFAEGHVHWDLFGSVGGGLVDYLYLGVKLGIYPCLIFLGIGAMTDFGPLIANPKSMLLGAAAQIGIFITYIAANTLLGFNPAESASIGIIGGADGPTAIFVTSKLAPELLGPIAVAAYSYMALVPFIQPPIMRLLTTKKERRIVMKELRPVRKIEKILFPIVVTVFVSLLVPSAAPLIGCLMLGNLLKESGVVDRIAKAAQNELMNIVTIFLGISVGATATANTFLSWKTLGIMAMGIVAFSIGSAGGVLLAKFMNLFLKNKINPLIGSAGVSAVPMAARVSQTEGQKADPNNYLLMHAMGPNVAGVIGSAIAAGVLIALFG